MSSQQSPTAIATRPETDEAPAAIAWILAALVFDAARIGMVVAAGFAVIAVCLAHVAA